MTCYDRYENDLMIIPQYEQFINLLAVAHMEVSQHGASPPTCRKMMRKYGRNDDKPWDFRGVA
jgi:hypothetical protein